MLDPPSLVVVWLLASRDKLISCMLRVCMILPIPRCLDCLPFTSPPSPNPQSRQAFLGSTIDRVYIINPHHQNSGF
jgi:hypothetical protein